MFLFALLLCTACTERTLEMREERVPIHLYTSIFTRAAIGDFDNTPIRIAYGSTSGHYTEYWDEDAEAAYLWNGETFISFESPEAIRRKCEFVKEKGMLGVMYWEHSADHTRELLTVIAKTLNI